MGVGVVECWSDTVRNNTPLAHYSNTPFLQYSNGLF
jgi:hypothetical protein